MTVVLVGDQYKAPTPDKLAEAIMENLVPGDDKWDIKEVNPGFPVFTLSCYECSNSEEQIESATQVAISRPDIVPLIEAAVLAGWRDMQHDDGSIWNYLGRCPECVQEQKNEACRIKAAAKRKGGRR